MVLAQPQQLLQQPPSSSADQDLHTGLGFAKVAPEDLLGNADSPVNGYDPLPKLAPRLTNGNGYDMPHASALESTTTLSLAGFSVASTTPSPSASPLSHPPHLHMLSPPLPSLDQALMSSSALSSSSPPPLERHHLHAPVGESILHSAAVASMSTNASAQSVSLPLNMPADDGSEVALGTASTPTSPLRPSTAPAVRRTRSRRNTTDPDMTQQRQLLLQQQHQQQQQQQQSTPPAQQQHGQLGSGSTNTSLGQQLQPQPATTPINTPPLTRRHTLSMAIPPHTSAPSLTNRLSVVENPNQSDYIDAADANANPAAMATMGSGMAYSNPDSPVHHVRTRSMTRKVSDNFGIGTKIDKTHEKYQFMFHMLTGIRVSVSRCEAKEDRDRDLLPDDFTAQHKLTSDVTGAELESSERYDFKFKDYAPYAFRKIRVSFGISSAEYLNSLTGKYILSELFSPGKSKSFLYYSHDYRYIIKTIHRAEQKLLLKILPAYVDYVSKYPNTLLARYYGLHRVRVPGGPTVHFVVMSNVFPPTYDIHETYDLKGSTIGRETPAEDINHKGKRAVLKDLNWTKLGRKLKLGPEKKRLFVEQLEKDVRFLMDSKCMDYSLLIGVHYLNRGNGGASEEVLKVFEPNKETLHRSLSTRADAMRAAIRHPDLTVLSHQSKQELLPDVSTERSGCLFFADNGGFQSSDAFNQPSDELYFMSIIDMLTPYNATKRFEHLFKSITSDGNQISAVRPSLYGKRFIMFMKGLVGQ